MKLSIPVFIVFLTVLLTLPIDTVKAQNAGTPSKFVDTGGNLRLAPSLPPSSAPPAAVTKKPGAVQSGQTDSTSVMPPNTTQNTSETQAVPPFQSTIPVQNNLPGSAPAPGSNPPVTSAPNANAITPTDQVITTGAVPTITPAADNTKPAATSVPNNETNPSEKANFAPAKEVSRGSTY
jgi:hypothetical protein